MMPRFKRINDNKIFRVDTPAVLLDFPGYLLRIFSVAAAVEFHI